MGEPLFTAYLSGPHQRQAAESAEMEVRLRCTAAIDSSPFYDNEAGAMAWLHDQQERAGMLPESERGRARCKPQCQCLTWGEEQRSSRKDYGFVQ